MSEDNIYELAAEAYVDTKNRAEYLAKMQDVSGLTQSDSLMLWQAIDSFVAIYGSIKNNDGNAVMIIELKL